MRLSSPGYQRRLTDSAVPAHSFAQPGRPSSRTRLGAAHPRLRDVLLSDVTAGDPSPPAIAQAVLRSVPPLTASSDWSQLQSVFTAAATAATAAAPQQPRSSSSSWGFALRQPGQTPRRPAAAQPQQQQPLDLKRVRHFGVLGLGSITSLPAADSSKATTPPARLGFRLMQLALALALHQHSLPGLTARPWAFDPEFAPADVQLLDCLGFEVLPQEPTHVVSGPTLLYMPCCPRQLYSDVLAANWSQLQQLAILGTSLSSLSNTQALFSALVSEGQGTGTADAVGSSSSRSTSEGGGSLQDSRPTQQQQPGVQPQADMVSQAYQQGRVIEVVCPDCSAHGVGVSLHTFCPL